LHPSIATDVSHRAYTINENIDTGALCARLVHVHKVKANMQLIVDNTVWVTGQLQGKLFETCKVDLKPACVLIKAFYNHFGYDGT
jgi:hypothetical protein